MWRGESFSRSVSLGHHGPPNLTAYINYTCIPEMFEMSEMAAAKRTKKGCITCRYVCTLCTRFRI